MDLRDAPIDWDEVGSLFYTFGDLICTDPLWGLVTCARQGHMGSLDHMRIEMPGGRVYLAPEIEILARRPDRKNFPTGPQTKE